MQMKSPKFTKATWFAALLLPSVHIMNAAAVMPSGEYACQVVAQGGRIGLVLVQADTKALAEKAAVGAEAFTTDNIRSPATRVVQCIARGEERFADYQFQQFYENVPM
jgi:hypothetical protein